MDLLALITEESLGIPSTEKKPLKSRKAARAIVFNNNNKVALIYTSKHGHHKIPGGGIEKTENWKDALKRESLEEIGCKVSIRDTVIGKIEEKRNKEKFFQTSYCGIADVIKDTGNVQLTQNEINEGYSTKPKWVTLQNALELMKNDVPKTYHGKFMLRRDTLFIEHAIKILHG